MDAPKFYRHGDVVLERVDSIPSDALPLGHSGQVILALGEITGHSHRLTATIDNLKAAQTKEGILYVSLTIPAPLTHEEHQEIVIVPGVYKRVFEREFDYAMESIRKVVD